MGRSTMPGRVPGHSLGGAIMLVALAAPAGAQATATPAPAPAPAAAQQAADAPKTRRVDARTEEILRKMSALLAGTPRFALEAEEQFDEVSVNAPRLQLSNVRRVAVARPNRFAADATGDTLNRATVYDGHTLSVIDKARNAYVTAEAPATIDATLDAIAEKLGIVVPLSDLVYSDPYSVLMEGVLYGEYRGVHQVGGVACHHLAFTQENIEWQLWVDAGEQPLPRRLLIAYVDEPGVPQYQATFTRWTLKPAFGDELFRFEAPEDATRVDPAQFQGRAGQPANATPAAPAAAAVAAPAAKAAAGPAAKAASKEEKR